MLLKTKAFTSPERFTTFLLRIYFNLKNLEKTVEEFIFSELGLELSTLLRNDFFFRFFKVFENNELSIALYYSICPTKSYIEFIYDLWSETKPAR